tara:strand:- start:1499 stop:1765 length:267 start_codon:yes stop_codon:yes gene_type:complete
VADDRGARARREQALEQRERLAPLGLRHAWPRPVAAAALVALAVLVALAALVALVAAAALVALCAGTEQRGVDEGEVVGAVGDAPGQG